MFADCLTAFHAFFISGESNSAVTRRVRHSFICERGRLLRAFNHSWFLRLLSIRVGTEEAFSMRSSCARVSIKQWQENSKATFSATYFCVDMLPENSLLRILKFDTLTTRWVGISGRRPALKARDKANAVACRNTIQRLESCLICL